MTRPLHLGLSTCPNDTFLAHGLLTGRVDRRGLDIALELRDVEELNRRLLAGELDAAKGSFHAALLASDELGVLPTGSALGFGNGPLLLARSQLLARGGGRVPGKGSRVLCPGAHTTATLLYRLFHPDGAEPQQVRFSRILPALEAGEADFGVCIHEARFTYAERGLTQVEDLGERWEQSTGAPLPLGGILARKALGEPTLRRLQAVLADSLDHGLAHPADTLPTMRRHAQELDDSVILAHVELYVNEHTRDLGPTGRAALGELSQRAAAAGVVPGDAPPLEVVGAPRLFHLLGEAAGEALLAGSPGPPGSHGSHGSPGVEGFVHLSFAHQLAGTLAAHFPGADRLLLLEVDPAGVGEHLRLEPSPRGKRPGKRSRGPFPHLFAPLERRHLLRRWRLARTRLPRLDEDPETDDPPGESLAATT